MSGEETPGSVSCHDVPGLLRSFESLGEDCDFGVVQRAVGVEPFGLLRFAGCHATDLAALLESRFEQLATPEDLWLEETGPRREYCVRSRRFSFEAHTENYAGRDDPQAVRTAQIRKLRFLKAQLLRDLTDARKLFVFKGQHAAATVQAIAAQVQAYGPNCLLWVNLADPGHRTGTVERMSDGLLRGFVSRFGSYDYDPSLPVEDWVTMCANAYRLWRGTDPPSASLANLIAQAEAARCCEWVSGAAAATGRLARPAPAGGVAFEHWLGSTEPTSVYHAHLPVTAGGSFVFSAWIRLPPEFRGRRIGALLHGFPTRASWDADVKSRGRWQRIWVAATLPDDAREISCGIVAEGARGDVFLSAAWCLERGARPSGYGFAL